MSTCEFENVTNNTPHTVMVSKLEDVSRNSFTLASKKVERQLIWLPEVSNASEFAKKVLIVLSMGDQRVLGFLWQSGGIVYASKTGYSASASALPGRNTGRITLTIGADGALKGD